MPIIIISSLLSFESLKAQVIVKVKPAPPATVVIKPAVPSPDMVWIDGHWKWNKRLKQYEWGSGYWVKPRKGYMWIPGHR